MAATAEPPGAACDVLFVCTAGVVRSPLAAGLLAREQQRRTGAVSWRICSAGVRARTGKPIDPGALQVALTVGLDLTGHRATPVDEQLLASPLVLTMTEQHRVLLVRLLPSALPRTFALVEFLRLSAPFAGWPTGPAAEVLSAAARAAHRARAFTPPARSSEDIPDPYGRSRSEYVKTLRQLGELTGQLADRLFGVA